MYFEIMFIIPKPYCMYHYVPKWVNFILQTTLLQIFQLNSIFCQLRFAILLQVETYALSRKRSLPFLRPLLSASMTTVNSNFTNFFPFCGC